MPPDDPHDVHAPYVAELEAAGDWAALVRYWMAHQHEGALQRAIDLVRRRSKQAPRPWRQLAEFLEEILQDPVSPRELPPKLERARWSEAERGTLILLTMYSLATLCELAGAAPPEEQDELYQLGITAFDTAQQIAAALQDDACAALFWALRAAGHRETGELEAAQNSYTEALRICRELATHCPEVYCPQMATTLNNLGNVQRVLNDLEAARDSFTEADELYDQNATTRPTARLAERIRCWSNLGRLYRQESPELGWPDRDRARRAFQQARRLAEGFRGLFLAPDQRRRVQAETMHVYEALFRTCLDLWEQRRDAGALEAAEVAEAARARNLMELLADEVLSPARTPPDLVEEFRTLRRVLHQALRRLQQELDRPEALGPPTVPTLPEEPPRGPSPPPDRSGRRRSEPTTRSPELVLQIDRLARSQERIDRLQAEVERLTQIYDECLRQIHGYDPEFDPDQPVPPIDYAAMQRLIPTDVPTAVVQYTLTADGGAALLLLTADGVDAVPLPALDANRAQKLTASWFETYDQAWGQRGDTPADLWDRSIPGLLRPVAAVAVQSVVEQLAGRQIGRLVLVPNRDLHVFPLHACRLADGRLLAEAYEVDYTPSLSILKQCADRHREARERLLAVQDPTNTLWFAAIDVAQVARRYRDPVLCRPGDEVKEHLLRQSGDRQIIHHAGHCRFNPEDPLDSSLQLDPRHHERDLTLRDIFCGLHLPEGLLVVLSGCESGMLRPDVIDEYVGLPSGFLYVGAACVVSSLWPVDDLSTALTMDRFYREWQSGRSLGAALREAQRWLREDIVSGPYLRDVVIGAEFLGRLPDRVHQDTCTHKARILAKKYPDRPPFAAEAHWAPFTATGLSFPLTPA